ncbi:hypothetical protein ACWGRF_03935 [Streptomyces zhihengii]
MWERVYRLWVAHAGQLRHELGEAPAENMLREAHQMLPKLRGRRAVLLTLRRLPGTPAVPAAVDRMAGPDHQTGDGHAPGERTPQ